MATSLLTLRRPVSTPLYLRICAKLSLCLGINRGSPHPFYVDVCGDVYEATAACRVQCFLGLARPAERVIVKSMQHAFLPEDGRGLCKPTV